MRYERLSRKVRAANWLAGLVMLGVILCLPSFVNATPTTTLLITDRQIGRVIELDPIAKSIIWEYGAGTLSGAYEAIPLTNGNIIIADGWNHRVIEVNPDKEIVWQWQPGTSTLNYPVDVKKTAQGTLLVVDGSMSDDFMGSNRVYEITHPGTPSIVWYSATLNKPREAERLPGTGTPVYLITEEGSGWGSGRVMLMQRDSTVLWEKTGLEEVCDATWLIGNSVLITEAYRVSRVDYPATATAWQRQDGYFVHREAIQMENGHILISGRDKVIEVDPLDNSVDWEYTASSTEFYDVEQKGITNIARIDYRDAGSKTMKPVFAGVVVPILQPVISSPLIVATKTVSPGGPQAPGATLTYRVSFQNIGAGTVTNVSIIDQIPPETEYILYSDSNSIPSSPYVVQVSHDGGLTYDNFHSVLPITHVKWEIDYIAPGATCWIQFQVVIK